MAAVAAALGQEVDGNKMQLSSHALSLPFMPILVDVLKKVWGEKKRAGITRRAPQ